MRKHLRTAARKIAWLSTFTAANLFVVGVFMEDTNPVIRYVWQGSAIAGIVAFAIETWLRRLDERDSDKLRERIDAAAQFTQSLIEERCLSDDGKAILKNRLSPFAEQKFSMFQVGTDSETGGFANEIAEFLSKECGWLQHGGMTYINPSQSSLSMQWGVAFYAVPEALNAGDEIIASRTIHAVGALCIAMQDAGITITSATKSDRAWPIPQGTIEIYVAQKPPPHVAHALT